MDEWSGRVLRFTIAEMRGILLATRLAPRPPGLVEAKRELELQLQSEWFRQQREEAQAGDPRTRAPSLPPPDTPVTNA